MTTKEILDRVLYFIQELTQFHAELSQELPDLRVVVDNTRVFSELKKMAQRLFHSLAQRRLRKKIYITKKPAAKPQLHRRLYRTMIGF